MKLIIQIPCFNEEKSLQSVLLKLPREVVGFSCVEWLLIDDGSTDRTVEIAKKNGMDHILRLKEHRGLANAYITGIKESLRLGADVIVNTDGDNQYECADISILTQTLETMKADIAIGTRERTKFPTLPLHKRFLYFTASEVVSTLTGMHTPDPTSGFRAVTRRAAYQLQVLGNYTYTIETLFQCAHLNFKVASVSVRTNPVIRPSRLIKNTPQYIYQTVRSVMRSLWHYRVQAFFAPKPIASAVIVESAV